MRDRGNTNITSHVTQRFQITVLCIVTFYATEGITNCREGHHLLVKTAADLLKFFTNQVDREDTALYISQNIQGSVLC